MLDLIGYLAAFCTTAAFIPQAVKVNRNRRTKDISIGMFLLLTVGITLWLVYGIIMMAFPIILANGITLIFALYILIMKIRLDYINKTTET